MTPYDVIVVGGGAAGLFCARTAGLRGRRVLVIDHAEKLGLKILISGGGRCNFTNLNTTWDDFVSDNPHFCKSALAQFTPQDFLRLVDQHKIPHHPKTPGQLFCDHSSRAILQMLLAECQAAGVTILHPTQLLRVMLVENNFHLTTSRGDFSCASLVLATGGVSYKKLGATALGYDLARQFGHTLTPLSPALVGFATTGALRAICESLAGTSLNVAATIGKRRFCDGLVFTHFGLSGPSLLNASLYWQKGQSIDLVWKPEVDLTESLLALQKAQPRLHLKNALKTSFPDRFVEALLGFLNIPDQPLETLSRAEIKARAERFQNLTFTPSDTAGFDRAEVTRGGVSCDEISSQTLQSKRQPGLFFVGEVLDVTGRLGGFNFQWAWSSGYVAGVNC